MFRYLLALRVTPVALGLLLSLDVHGEEPLDCVIEPHVMVDISSSEFGVLGVVAVDEADAVRRGEVVAELRTEVERAALELSRARADAMAELRLLDRDHQFNARKRERFDELHRQRAVSPHDMDEVRTAEELAELRLGAATERHRTARLEAARDALALERRIVRSPINGVVVQRYKVPGEYVEGDPIVQIAQLDPLRVKIVAPISQFGQILPGMQATVVPELAVEGSFIATVTSVDPVVDAATATFGVRLSLPNPERDLPPGLKCSLVMHPATKRVVGNIPADRPDPSSQAGPGTTAEPAIAGVTAVPPVTAKVDPAGESGPARVLQQRAARQESSVPRIESSVSAFDARAGSLCATIGPIRTDTQLNAIAARLAANGTAFERRESGVRDETAQWLVLSREAFAEPDEMRARLRRAGVSDFQRLSRDDWQHRFSFGLYSGELSARRRLATIQALGFDAELVQRGGPAIWLDLLGTSSIAALPPGVTAVLDDHPMLTLESMPCTRLASR